MFIKMPMSGFFAVAIGAVLGSWCRWGLGILLNTALPQLPLGTLVANGIGGYLIGLAMGFISHVAPMPEFTRLLFITGFLGALTTFSTFSAEAIALLQKQEYGWMLLHVSSHLFGSLAMVMLGIGTIHLLKQSI